jgi:hypothetical protein
MLIGVSAAHGRHALTEAWIAHTLTLGFDKVIVVVTNNDAVNFLNCARAGFYTYAAPNEPLAGKFNLGAKAAYLLGADKMMILPSDDFASPAWVKAAREEPGDYLVPHTCGVIDAKTQRAYKIVKNALTGQLRFGAGRVVSRAVLEAVNCELWPAEANRGLDTGSNQRILRAGFKPKVVVTEGIPITDVKTEHNIWPFNTWSGESVTADQALHMVNDEVRNMLNSLS